MASIIPGNMQLIAQYLANMERSVIRVRPQSNDQVAAGQTIHFRLPTNTLVDLHNLQFYGMCEVEGDIPHGLPVDMQQSIERVDVIVNGQNITGNNNDHGGLHALMHNHLSGVNARSEGQFLTSGDNKVIIGTEAAPQQTMRAILSQSNNPLGASYGTSNTGDFTHLPKKWPFVINGLMGFLSGHYVRFIDTAVLGPVEIQLRLANGNICYRGTEAYENYAISKRSTSGNPHEYDVHDAPGFVFSQMYMYLDTISFVDDMYRALLANRLRSGVNITIPYQNFHSFQKSITSSSDTVTFNLATQSLNYLVATFRNGDYNKRKSKKWSDNALNTNFYKFVSADDTKYDQGQFTSTTRYQYSINNKLVPTWPASVDETYVLTRAALDLAGELTAIGHVSHAQQFRDGQFAFIQCFEHHGEMDKVISGVDTRGASSNMAFAAENLSVGTSAANAYERVNCIIWALTTATLEISAGQNVTTIL